MATFLVTGGAGFIGSTITEALLAKGEKVRVLDDFSSGRRQNLEGLKGDLEVIEGTIVDPETVKRAVQGVEVIFHEAAIPSVARSVERPQNTMLACVQGTTVVLDVARHNGVKRVVFAASSSAYGNTPTLPKVETMPSAPLSPYAVAKLTCEHLMRVFAALYPIETVSLRYFNVFGARQDPTSHYAAVIPNFITAAIKKTQPVIFGDGEQTRDFTFVADAVEATYAAAVRGVPGRVYNIGGGSRVSVNEILPIIERCVGRPLNIRRDAAQKGDMRDTFADTTAARADIGFAPTVSLADGLAAEYEWLCASPARHL